MRTLRSQVDTRHHAVRAMCCAKGLFFGKCALIYVVRCTAACSTLVGCANSEVLAFSSWTCVPGGHKPSLPKRNARRHLSLLTSVRFWFIRAGEVARQSIPFSPILNFILQFIGFVGVAVDAVRHHDNQHEPVTKRMGVRSTPPQTTRIVQLVIHINPQQKPIRTPINTPTAPT